MKANKNSLFYLLPFIVISLLVFIAWKNSQTEATNFYSSPQGTPLPVINLPMLLQPAKRFTTKILQGKICLLNIWASWCPACRAEHPTLMAIKAHYPIPIYGITFKDNTDNAKAWLRKAGNPYILTGVDTNGVITTDLSIDGIPETFLLDKNGMIRYRFRGSLDINTWESILLPLIEQLTNEQ